MRTALIAVAGLFVLVAAYGIVQSQDTGDTGPFGAIAYSKSTGNWAWGTGNDLNEAQAKARSLCKSDDCIVYTSTHKSCAGLAQAVDGSYFGWSWSQPNHGKAEIRAMNECLEGGSKCRIIFAGCTLR
jgi:hypothetical protein